MVNLPNFFSLTRIILILPFIVLITHQLYGWALAVFIVAALTDAIDGTLARLLRQRTVLGAYLDPAADKLLMTASYIALAIPGVLPAWLAILVIGRDLIIVLGLLILRLRVRVMQVQPSMASKITTVLQLITIGIPLFSRSIFSLSPMEEILIAATAAGTIISGLQYIGKGLKIWRKKGD
jgi:cardiolipin synthase